jgi:hypothetical protein
MNAPIVVYYTVLTAMVKTEVIGATRLGILEIFIIVMMVLVWTKWMLAKNAIKLVVSLVECAYIKKGVLTALIASNYYQTKQSNH